MAKSKPDAKTPSSTPPPSKDAPSKGKRRPAAEIIVAMQSKRHDLAKRLNERLSKLDARIDRLEVRYEKQTKLAEIRASLTADQISHQLDEMKRMQKLLKQAIRTKA